MERQPNIGYKALSFLAYSNTFISISTSSLAFFSLAVFKEKVSPLVLWITFGATFLLYNTQQLLLGYLVIRKTAEYKQWLKKNRVLFIIMALVAGGEIYPVITSSVEFIGIYSLAFLVSLLYFLPVTNLRSIPLLKSFIIGFVWTLICVVAPLGLGAMTNEKIHFATAQLLFITALCVLFNIRDVEQDRSTGTFTVPVLYGIRTAKLLTALILCGYLSVSFFVSGDLVFVAISIVTFLLGQLFTIGSSPQRHGFYYLYGVDGIILIQSIMGIVFLKA